MKINVQGGTANHGENLCNTCSRAAIREGQNNERQIKCSWFDHFIHNNTYKCNMYRHTNAADLYDMKQIAWVITGEGKDKVGFRPFRELPIEEQRKFDEIEW